MANNDKDKKIAWVLFVLVGLYLFVLALTGFKEAWALVFQADASSGMIKALLDHSLRNPLASLFAGVVITSLIQSSSASIAMIIASVASGAIESENSIYILLGANIGTSVTASMVSLGHAVKNVEFRRVVPAAILDDMYKVLNISFFFLIEWSTGLLHKVSFWFVDGLSNLFGGAWLLSSIPNFLDIVTEPLIGWVVRSLQGNIQNPQAVALVFGAFTFAVLILALRILSHGVSFLIDENVKNFTSQIGGSRWRILSIGFVICWLLQSSSVAISVLLPLVANEVLLLRQVYYYSLGAALATTCDPGQLLSYIKFGPVGLKVGMAHILVNLLGVIIFSSTPGLKRLPIQMAEAMGRVLNASKLGPIYVLTYVLVLFYVLPITFIFFL